MNYYKTEMWNIKNKTAVMHTLGHSDNETGYDSMDTIDDEDSSMAGHVVNHRSYFKSKDSKTTMCSTKAAMELMAYQSKKTTTTDKLNAKRAVEALYKQVLEVDDIG